MHKVDKARRNILGLGCIGLFGYRAKAFAEDAPARPKIIRYRTGKAQSDWFARSEIRNAIRDTFPADFSSSLSDASFLKRLEGAKDDIQFLRDVGLCNDVKSIRPTVVWPTAPLAKLLLLDPFFDRDRTCEKRLQGPIVLTASMSPETQSLSVRVIAGYNAVVELEQQYREKILGIAAFEHTLIAIGKTTKGNIVKGVGKYYVCAAKDEGECTVP